jgi:hypothetical protein
MQRVIFLPGNSRRGSSGYPWTYPAHGRAPESRGGNSGGAVIIVQHAIQPLAEPDRSTITSIAFVRDDQPVVETLLVSLATIMPHSEAFHHDFFSSFLRSN